MRLRKLKLFFFRKRTSKHYREIFALVVFALTGILAVSLLYYRAGSGCSSGPAVEFTGDLGCSLAASLRRDLGLSAFLLPFLSSVLLYMIIAKFRTSAILIRFFSYTFLVFCALIFLTAFSGSFSTTASYAGGRFGEWAYAKILIPRFGENISRILASSLLLASFTAIFRISVLAWLGVSARSVIAFLRWARPRVDKLVTEGLLKPALRMGGLLKQILLEIAEGCLSWIVSEGRKLGDSLALYLKTWRTKNARKELPRKTIVTNETAIAQSFEAAIVPAAMPEEKPQEIRDGPKKLPARIPVQQKLPLLESSGHYSLPSTNALDTPNNSASEIDRATVDAGKVTLQKKLEDLGISGKVIDPPQPGPIITMYRFDPDPGVKVRRIVALADDLAMAMKAFGVRVLAPIPGESVVGVEVPNPRREKVTIFLREVIESVAFQNASSKLTLALGKQITGEPFVDDLARMPHLLVAGATGTGKSVSLNAMILSVLFKATPEEVKFIMIDPKMLELAVYEGIPHLLVPVVTDPKKAAAALFWAMQEMDQRYRLMRQKGARNIDHYNRLFDKEARKAKDAIALEEIEEARSDSDAIGGNLDSEESLVHRRLPRIVVIVDELADLMMTVRRDIEEHITRLAQKARAAGIHLIMATQRPSVDVITGLIKANFPARISFQVTSRIDSRTILDSIGAEKLLGNGDMLFLPPGTARLIRVHGAYVSDDEVKKVVEHVKSQGKPDYRPEILEAKKVGTVSEVEDIDDEMYDQAVACIVETQQASISMVQRRLRIGYNRAARLIDKMEKEGVVGPTEGSRPREVFIKKVETTG